MFTLGVVNDSIDNWKKTIFNDEIEGAARVFMGEIGTGTDEDLKEALQPLLFAIFNQKRIGMEDKYSTLVYSFLVLYSYCKEGHLNRCNTFTQYFSRIIWFGRVSIYNAIKEEGEAKSLSFFE